MPIPSLIVTRKLGGVSDKGVISQRGEFLVTWVRLVNEMAAELHDLQQAALSLIVCTERCY